MAGFRFNVRFNAPYYEGGGSTTLAPYLLDVAVGGHPYMIDWSAEMPLRHVSIPILRQQQDTSDAPGEQSINSEGLWRRVGESWHLGAGQEKFDRKESSPFRFNNSQGVDVWTKWGLSLLPTTQIIDADAAVGQRISVAGNYLYYSQGAVLKYTDDLDIGATPVTGTPVGDILSMASNGFHVWTAHVGGDVYRTERNTPTTTLHITGEVSLLAYVKNRVMGAFEGNLYDLTAIAVGTADVLPTPLFTHGNTDWQWVAFAESQQFIYAAGYSGDKSLIYALGITTDGTVLGQPVVAGTLPDGEMVTGLYGYLGRFLAIGTNKGFRLALASDGGGLNMGSLIETPEPVTCFEGQESFIWFNYSNFASIVSTSATGLGRMNTAGFSDVDNFVPAYASDLMLLDETADISSIVTFQDRRVFAVDGLGIYAEHATELVEAGAIDTGAISYGLTELKTALFIDLQVDGANMTSPISVSLSIDGGTFNSIGTYQSNEMGSYATGEAVGNEFELRLIIGQNVDDPTGAASILSWLLRTQVRPLVTNLIFATILLNTVVTDLTGNIHDYNCDAELDYIEQLNITKSVITFQRNKRLYSVVLEDYEMNLYGLTEDTDGSSGFNASCLLKLKRI